MERQNLPGASTITTLWIIALVFLLVGCCCGILGALPSMILSIIALVMVKKNLRLFQEQPEDFVAHSYKSVKTGRIMSIITLVLSSIITIISLIYIIFFGAGVWSGMYNELNEGGLDFDVYETETYEDDTNSWEEDTDNTWEEDKNYEDPETDSSAEGDTLLIETLEIDSIQN